MLRTVIEENSVSLGGDFLDKHHLELTQGIHGGVLGIAEPHVPGNRN